VEAFIGIIVGAAITWLVTWLYYRKAAKELSCETSELRRLTTLVLDGLEKAKMINLTRNESGQISGLNVIVEPPAGQYLGEEFKMKAQGNVLKRDEKTEDVEKKEL
jgi:hypothetical protein